MNGHLYKDKIRFSDWESVQNYLEGIKGYFLKLNLKEGTIMSIDFTNTKLYLGLVEKLIRKLLILSLRFYLSD